MDKLPFNKVKDPLRFIDFAPTSPSDACLYWMDQIESGWRPQKSIQRMELKEKDELFGVYRWELRNIIEKLLFEKLPIVDVPNTLVSFPVVRFRRNTSTCLQ